jgi:adenosylhomocysteine nucleosidase
MNIVVLISANAEWRAVKEILSPDNIETTPLGETFITSQAGRATSPHIVPLRGRQSRRLRSVPMGYESPGRGTDLRFFHGGWGKVSAAATTQYAIDRWQPDLLVNLGTCGGFAGRIERGAIILAEKTLLYDIIEQMEDPAEAIAHYATELDLSWLPDNEPLPVQRGLLISADRDIVAAEIPALVEKYGAVAADWESGAIAWVAKKNGVRCLILRGVTDLVSPHGGEAYSDISVFHENTKKVMKQLLQALPGWIKD